MTVAQCNDLFEAALNQVTQQINSGELGDFNEATVQHHLAMALHLLARDKNVDFDIVLEKRVSRGGGLVFPKKQAANAYIDIYFELGPDNTRCAIELKLFKAKNNREPNNRYEAYADIANLEIYRQVECDVGYFALFTDHRHYFDNAFRVHSKKTGDFCLRNGHRYNAGRELAYRTNKPHGPNLRLENSYEFNWSNENDDWRRLILKIE